MCTSIQDVSALSRDLNASANKNVMKKYSLAT